MAGLGIIPLCEDAGGNQRLQPRAKHAAAALQRAGEIVKARQPVNGLADDQQRPLLAQHVQRPLDAAILQVVLEARMNERRRVDFWHIWILNTYLELIKWSLPTWLRSNGPSPPRRPAWCISSRCAPRWRRVSTAAKARSAGARSIPSPKANSAASGCAARST